VAPAGTDRLAAFVFEPTERGLEPLTPGDASFRTTTLDTPTAIANTFDLTYSLGEIIRFTPGNAPVPANATAAAPRTQGFVAAAGSAGSDTEGFVPAAGSAGPEAAPDAGAPAETSDCRGTVNRGLADTPDCTLQAYPESFWSTATEGVQ
jgi:hypothetical protein